MTYSSTPFIFFSLFGVLGFYLLPFKLRTAWLLLLSVFWFSSWDISWLVAYIFLMTVNYCLLRLLPKEAKFLLPGLVLLNGCFFIAGKGAVLLDINEPSGISFFIFLNLAMIMDYVRSARNSLPFSLLEFLLLPIYFPLMMGGPLERGEKFFSFLREERNFSLSKITDGILVFSLGFIKAEILSPKAGYLLTGAQSQVDTILYWPLIGFLGTFKAFLIFSGFCDMGRGISKLFGIELTINFRSIYLAKNPNDFWQRWNISLGTWIRDYVSFPMLLKFGRKINQNALLAFSFFLVGIWHGLTLKWLIFGLFNGMIIVSYNLLRSRIKVSWPGYFFSYSIIIGNGLILSSSNHSLHLPWSWQPILTLTTLLFFSLLIVIEIVQERRNKADWFLEIPLTVKSLLALILICAFLYQIDSAPQVRGGSLRAIPEYFKI